MKRKFIAFTLALIGCCGIASALEIIDNGVYRIDQAYYKDNSMTVTGSKGITYEASNSNDEKQLWVLIPNSDHTGYYVRNYATGYYMTSPVVKNQQWTAGTPENLNDKNCVFAFKERESNGDIIIYPISIVGTADEGTQNGYAHAASSKVICYRNGAGASGWQLTYVPKTPAEIAAKKTTWANFVSEITPGKAYRIINDYYGHAMTPGNNNSLVGTESNKSNINQIWIVETNTNGEGYFIRNYESGKVVASSCVREKAWSLHDVYVPDQAASAMYFVKKASGFGFSTISTRDENNESNNYTFAHENNVTTILGYVVNSNPSLWHFSPVEEISAADIAAKTLTWECYKKNKIDMALASIFTDLACTQLTPKYASMDPAKFDTDPNVLALPEGLRPMVRKIRTGDWSEPDPYHGYKWDS
ncbi:MAG: hypothetical protein K2K97_03710, partial [Muribaculaceae bacterium]|nr:hypothetical protein [Muribaculaceae bacterium]